MHAQALSCLFTTCIVKDVAAVTWTSGLNTRDQRHIMMDSPGPYKVMPWSRPADNWYLQGTVCQEVSIISVWGLDMMIRS